MKPSPRKTLIVPSKRLDLGQRVLEELVDDAVHAVGADLVRQARRVGDVAEQDRHLLAFAFAGGARGSGRFRRAGTRWMRLLRPIRPPTRRPSRASIRTRRRTSVPGDWRAGSADSPCLGLV